MDGEQLYNSTFKLIYRYFYYRNVAETELEDLSQEVYLRFFKAYDSQKLDQLSSQKILYRIASNVYKEWVRTAIKSQTWELDENLDSPLSQEELADPDFEAEQERLKQLVLAGLEQLHPVTREVIRLRCIEGLTRKEVGERLQMKEKYVHIYQQRGIRALIKWCGSQGKAVSLPSYTKQRDL